MMGDRDDKYWSIDVPGLSESKAEALLGHAEVILGLSGTAVDPVRWLTRHLDVDTVRSIVRAFEVAGLHDDDQAVVDGVREDFANWLRSRP